MLKQRTTYRTSTAKHFSKALLVCIVVFAAQTTYAQFQLQVTVPADSLTATLPLFGTVNATVNWGGAGTTATETTYTTTGSQSYTYTNAGTYIISVTGTLTQFGNGATGYTNADKITKMISFGSVGLTSLSGAFYNASRLDSVPATLPSSVTDLSYMFYGATSFNCVNDTGWNVGKVTNMTSMFQNATAFNQNLSGWCVSRIASAPTDFATGASAWGLPQPVWGTCSSQFVIKVNVTTAPYTVYLPLYGTVNATVYWGGASSSGAIEQTYTSAGNKTYTYTNAGTYTISISGTVTQFGNGTSSSSYASKFTEVLSFGSVGLTSLYGAFNGATNLTSVPSTLPSTVTDLSYMFYGATSFNSTNDTGWNVSNVTNMSYMFSGATAFNQSLNGWNVGNVTNMSNMFFGAAAFNGDIGNWVVSNVTNMSYMFSADTAFNQNIGSWNVSKVTDMSNMFSYASAFNQNIGSWDVGNVTTMSNMFFTTAAFNQSLNGWNVSKVTDMSYMFGAAGSFNQDLNNWNVSNVTNMNYMFSSAIVFNQNIAGWTVSNVTTMNGIFASATAFNQEIGNWNVGKVTIMSNMFAGAAAFNADIGSWNVNNVTDMGNMFSNASAFNNNIGSWNVGKVTNMNYMFFRAAAFNQDLSGWCVSRISSIPNNFAYNATAWVLAKPVWGICSSQFQLKVTVVSGSMTVTLPLRGTVNATVYWGGAGTTATEQTYTTPVNQSFTYNTAGTYIISISGTLAQFGPANNSYPNADRITEVISWGNVGLTSLAGAFFGATNLTSVPATLPSTVTNMLFMFYGATSFNSANVAGWDVSNVTNMNCMFFLATAFNQDISNWNVSNVTSMGAMFGSAAVFNQDISNWNVGKVTNMSYMFAGAAAFNADIGSWNVGAVTDMLVMFSSATSFNQNIGSWDVSKVTKMNYMFQNANTFNKNIGNWNVGAVTDMSYMFEGASAFNQNIGTWNVSNVTNMNYMFRNASVFNQNISSWNVSNVYTMSYMFYGAYVFNGNIGSWNVSKVTDMSYMFSSATSFNQNISSWDVSRVTSMASMFYGASAFNQDLSGWCVSRIAYWPTNFSTSATAWVLPKPVWGTCSGQFILKVTVAAGGQVTLPLNGTVNATVYWGGASSSGTIEQTYTSAGNKTYTYTNAGTYTISISGTVTQFGNGATANTNGSKFTEVLSFGSVGLTSLSGAFNGATNLISVPATLPSTVTDLSYMFKGATLFNSANDSLWDVSNVTNMSYMFYGAPVFNRNIGSWNVGNVTNMSNMFYNASAFNQNIGSWVVSKVTNMDVMFMGASAFNQDIGNWNVGNVTTMNNMFTSAAAFNKNIGTWNVANVTSMSAMFSGATVFNQNIGSWNVGNVTNMYDMFHGLTSFNQNIGSWNVGNVTNMIQMFYNASSFNQDLSGWCVSRVPSIPSFFATGANAWVLPKPVWGTCTSQFQLKVIVTDGSKSVSLPLYGTVNVAVNWGGSGTTAKDTTYTTAGIKTYTYASAGTYIIGIQGTLTQFGNGSSAYSYANKITEMISFGSVGLTSLSGAFNGATSLTSVPATLPSTVTNTSYMFKDATSFNSANDTGWNVSNVTDMSSMFSGATMYNKNIGNWNVSNVTTMNSMFYGASAFNQNIGSWNTGKVTDMTSMFQNAVAFNQNLSGWCVSRITTIPSNFSTGASAWVLAKPVWGSCSSQFVIKVSVPTASCFVTLPLQGTVNATVYWGGAGTTAIETTYTTAGIKSFTYSAAGTYTISIAGTVTQFGYGYTTDTNSQRFTEVVSFGSVGLTSLSGAFNGASNLTSVPATLPSTVTNTSSMFYGASKFNSANVAGWDVSNVTNMESMFALASTFNQNIGAWNVSNVTNMGSMFYGANAFNGNIGSWNVGNVANMANMFQADASFNQNIGGWNVSKVQNMAGMFNGATSFNQNIGNWNVGNVTNMTSMFYNAAAFNGDLSGWCVSRITTIPSNFSTGATAWLLAKPVWGICSSQFQLKVTVAAGGQVTLPLYGTVNATVYWGGAGTTAIETTYTTTGDKKYTYTSAGTYIISISGTLTQFGNGAAANTNGSKFTEVISFGSVGLTSLSGAFNGATRLTSVPATLPSTVTDLSYMFKGAALFNSANDTGWNVSNVTNMSYMFYGASVFNQNISSWNVGAVTDMQVMFAYAYSFNQNIGSWDVSKVTIMNYMFLSANTFNADIGSWNVGNVTNMSYMFSNATAFNKNIGSWDVGKVTNMNTMFQNAVAFNQDLSGWCVSRIASMPTDFSTGATAWLLAKPVWGICSSQFQLKVTVTSVAKTVTLPLRGTVNATVYWGGSGTTAIEQTYTSAGDYSFTYSSAGTYIISISGTVTQFGNGVSTYSNADKITKVISFGSVGLTSLSGAFNGATSLDSVPATQPGTVTNLSYMFKGATSFNSANITGWNVSKVADMSSMFYGATAFNQNISSWPIRKANTMAGMFSGVTISEPNYSALLTGWYSYSDTVRTITAFANGGTSATTVTTSTPHYFSVGDTVIIGGTTNYNGRWKVTAVSGATQCTIAKSYVAETPSVSSTVVLARIRYVTFNGGNSAFSPGAATTARQNLISNLYWTITDGGSLPDLTTFYVPDMILSGRSFGVATEYTLAGIAHPFAGNVTLTVASGPGTLSGNTTAAAVNGIAGFSGLSLSAAGNYTLQASSSAMTSTSSSFKVYNYTAGGSGDGHTGYGIASYGLDGVPVFQWSGITSDWFTGSNWSRGTTPSPSVLSERILIPPVATLPVISGTTANNLTLSSELIVKDQATLTLNAGPVLTLSTDSRISTLGTTGRLVITSGASFLNYSTSSPRIEAHRAITGSKGWRLLSGPVKSTYSDLLSGFVSQGFTGATYASQQPNFLWFDETDAGTTLQGWRKPAQMSDSTTTGRGYFLYVFNGAGKPSPLTGNYGDQLPITMNVIGNEPAISASGYNFNVTRTFRQRTPSYTPGNAAGFIDVNLQDQGWNLISNPTTSTINWNASSGWTKTNIGNSIYVWDPSASSGNGAYLTWNGSVGDLGSGLIAPFQSFWIKADSLPVLKMNNSVKTVGGTFRKVSSPDSAENFPSISLRLRSGDLLCDKFITFTPSGKLGLDDLDAYSLVPLSDTYVTLFSQSADGQPSMKIQNLPLYGYEVPLIFPLYAGGFNSSTAINGIFTLNWTFNGTVPDGWKILLVDDGTKKAYPLTEAGSMEFSFATPASLYDRQASSVGMAKSEPGSLFEMPVHERNIESESNEVQHIAARRTAAEPVKKMAKTTSAVVPELVSAQTVATEKEFDQTYDGGSGTTWSAGDSVLPAAVMVNPYPRVQRVMQKNSGSSLGKTSADENRFRIAVLPGREWDIEGYIPRTPEIHQNYPNPFNPATSIKFSVPKQTRVRLEVFNVLGQRVTTLADQEFQAGFHTVTWNARGVASGMYLCRFAADKELKTIKMILLK